MTIDELRLLVARGETEHVEFKRSTGNLSEGLKTVCAMLNGTRPGYVVFGVNDRSDLVGQEVSTRTLEDIANNLRKIQPPCAHAVERETVNLENGRAVIVLRTCGDG